MQTEAVFENIAERIQQEISKAQKSVYIAVAWFTNKNLFSELENIAQSGCKVALIISDDPINKALQNEFNQLNTNNFCLYKIGNSDTELMHNKFCIIDSDKVITGSYNWSYKAENNFENIVVTSGDTTLASQFITEFNKILEKYFPNEPRIITELPLNKIIKRLEILKNYILLEDIEELNKETGKLKEYDFNSDLQEIIENVRKEEFAVAIINILNFINKNQQLSIWTDPEIAALKLEIKNIENQLNALENEKTDLEKVLAEFQHLHTIELGEIILEILRLRKIKFKSDESKYEEAVEDEKQYQEQLYEEREKEIFELTVEEKEELKKKYRKATMLCHPDKFVNETIEIQRQAEAIFKELNDANAKNDLVRVTEILESLEKGLLTTVEGDGLTDKEILRKTINGLRAKLKRVEAEIIVIVESETYNTIISIENWEDYFRKTRKKLKRELEDLKIGIEENI